MFEFSLKIEHSFAKDICLLFDNPPLTFQEESGLKPTLWVRWWD
ncbi:hypothetical protein [Helicobacter pylori]|nr:hypothetical protein [Helicobacter pylori]